MSPPGPRRRRPAPAGPAAHHIAPSSPNDLDHGSRPGAHPNVRLSGPDTSIAASTMATEHRETVRRRAHAAIRAAGIEGRTAAELGEEMPDVHGPTLGRRVTQLAQDGLVIDSGRRRPTPRGCPAIVWIATSEATG